METAETILLVDDQPDLLANISMTLEAAGYAVFTATDGQEALGILRSQPVSLILADIAMPGLNGYQLYERVRENPQWVMTPFLFLTARSLDSDIRYGKELGVDDYLTKPIEVEDLLAVVQGKLRRVQQLSAGSRANTFPTASSPSRRCPPGYGGPGGPHLIVGRLEVNPGQHQAWLNEQPLKLSAREFKLLEYLAQHADQVVPPTTLIQVTHDLKTDHIEAGALLRPLIRSLRRKLGYDVGEMGCIENVRGVGYRLVPPE